VINQEKEAGRGLALFPFSVGGGSVRKEKKRQKDKIRDLMHSIQQSCGVIVMQEGNGGSRGRGCAHSFGEHRCSFFSALVQQNTGFREK